MKKRSKIIALACICAFLFSLIGCGSNKASNKEIENAGAAQVENQTNEGKEETQTQQDSNESANQELEDKANTAEETETEKEEEVQLPENVSLKEVYEQYGVKVGTCINPWTVEGEQLDEIVTSQFNSATMENQMKPEATLDQNASKDVGDLVVKFNDEAISMMKWAKEHNFLLRGHTLVWYSQTPSWIFYDNFDNSGNLVDRDTMIQRMESYIKQVFMSIDDLGYTDLFYAYDVVNEAIMEDGSFRADNNLWYSVIGEDYIWYAFNFAKKYAPSNIKLFYNDYNEQFKVDAVTDLVESLKDSEGNSLIDGLGMQAHLFTQDDLKQYLDGIRAYAKLGLQIQITELDVGLGKYNRKEIPTDDKLREQGQFYYELLSEIISIKEETDVDLNSITFWGYGDAMSWRQEYNPNLYNRKLDRKYAYFASALMKEYAGYVE